MQTCPQCHGQYYSSYLEFPGICDECAYKNLKSQLNREPTCADFKECVGGCCCGCGERGSYSCYDPDEE
jgi:hypothetical protein